MDGDAPVDAGDVVKSTMSEEYQAIITSTIVEYQAALAMAHAICIH
jgi:hypothetical protein